MTTRTSQINEQLIALANHLAARREAILQAWRRAAETDPELTTGSTLSRAQFNDHIPEVLDAFERKLSARERAEKVEAAAEQKESAGDHGMHRWQQGYDQREAMREWFHLQLCLLDELESYDAANPDLAPGAMVIARRGLAELCGEGVIESAARYARLQQAEATGRLRDFEQALTQLNELERQRVNLWREAAHDLRGNLGVLQNATTVLNRDGLPESTRTRFLTMLQKGVASLHTLLSDLTSLARLEAGHERRSVAPFDVALVLAELCANFQPIADERGLFLRTEGPHTLSVEGDAVKTIRIAQNLLLNALKYTERGGVQVSWRTVEDGGDRWILCVQDTGPGFEAGSVTPLARVLKHATEEAVEQKANDVSQTNAEAAPAPTLASQSSSQPTERSPGEGIGLSIVKRLCELLDATLELHSSAGAGTTFRVIFPSRYERP